MNEEKRTNKKASSALGRQIRFWGRYSMEELGIALGVSLLLLLFWGFGAAGNGEFHISDTMGLLGYYLIIAASFTMFLMVRSYFLFYFYVLVSMNVIRKKVIGGILISQTVVIAGITAITALIWKLFPGDISAGGLSLIPLFAGVLFLSAAFCCVLGVMVSRWGKIGAIIMVMSGMLFGGCIGAAVSLISEEFMEAVPDLLNKIGGFQWWIVTGIGVLLYALAGVFAVQMLKKTEVRA